LAQIDTNGFLRLVFRDYKAEAASSAAPDFNKDFPSHIFNASNHAYEKIVELILINKLIFTVLIKILSTVAQQSVTIIE
jgi:hypothetical protein